MPREKLLFVVFLLVDFELDFDDEINWSLLVLLLFLSSIMSKSSLFLLF